jgi:hypothetical protein
MSKFEIDLSNERFHPVWMLVGALIGRAAGLMLGMSLGNWYIADPGAVIVWQILGIFVGAMFYSFMMTSDAGLRLKYSLLGLGTFFALAMYGGEIWTMFQHREVRGLGGMEYSEGIFFDWFVTHSGVLGGIVGWIMGNVIVRRQKKMTV